MPEEATAVSGGNSTHSNITIIIITISIAITIISNL